MALFWRKVTRTDCDAGMTGRKQRCADNPHGCSECTDRTPCGRKNPQEQESIMKQVYRNLCTYSSDLFGINSALYELGGLIVMHDASGCNSTYNTHDEPRWYTMDSMVYVSGLTERDAILGNDERLIGDVTDVALREHPKFIALSRSVLPTYLGTDMRGIARVIERRTGIPTFGFTTNGMDSYVCGAEEAYLALAERFCRAPGADGGDPARNAARRAGRETSVAVLGVTPLDFSVNGNVEAIRNFVRDSGFRLQSCWSMGSTLEEIADTPSADVTLVVSVTGLPAARYLQEKFGVPFVLGIPAGRAASERLAELLRLAARTGEPQSLFEEGTERRPRVVLVGEAFHCASLRYYLEHECGVTDAVINCPLEKDGGVLRGGDQHLRQEEEITELLRGADAVIADPVYRRVTPDDVLFLEDPHDAYSGRMYHARGRRFCGVDADPFPELRNRRQVSG